MLRVNEGVVGMKGFVPAEQDLLFCCEDCVKDYFDLTDLPKVRRRILSASGRFRDHETVQINRRGCSGLLAVYPRNYSERI